MSRLIEALQEEVRRKGDTIPAGFQTVEELAAESKLSQGRVREIIRFLSKLKRVETKAIKIFKSGKLFKVRVHKITGPGLKRS